MRMRVCARRETAAWEAEGCVARQRGSEQRAPDESELGGERGDVHGLDACRREVQTQSWSGAAGRGRLICQTALFPF